MKRSIALLVAAGVTSLLLFVILAVAAPKTDTPSAASTAQPDQIVTVMAPPSTTAVSADVTALQAQLEVMQQREATYQQRLQEAYAQLQSVQSQAAPVSGRDTESHEVESHEANDD